MCLVKGKTHGIPLNHQPFHLVIERPAEGEGCENVSDWKNLWLLIWALF